MKDFSEIRRDAKIKSLVYKETSIAIVQLIAEGYNNKEIGAKLNLAPRTITTYIDNLIFALELKNRTHLAIYFLRNQIID